jgi:hypothetical protein
MKGKIFFCLAAIALLFANTAECQTILEDVIYLKNGGVVRGQILELVPEKTVKIETYGGNVWVFPMNDVEKVSKEPSFQAKKVQRNFLRDQGFYGMFTPMLNVGQTRWSSIVNGGVQIINGYRFNRYLGAGGGIGLEVFDNWVVNPLFAEVRGHLIKGEITPFYHAGLGYGATILNESTEWSSVNGGLLLQGGLGLATYLGGSSFFTFGIGLRQQNLSEKRTNWWWNQEPVTIVNRHKFNRIVFNIGILF